MKPIKTGVLSVDKHIVFAHFTETAEAEHDPAPVDPVGRIRRAAMTTRTIAETLAGTPTRYTPPICHGNQPWSIGGYVPIPLDQCTHAPGFHNPGGAVISPPPGFKRRRDGSVWLAVESFAPRPIPERTRENIAACAAVGLAYWSEAPNARLWAIDDAQAAHEIRIDRTAAKVSDLTGEYRPFVTPTSDQLLVDA